MSSKIEMQGRRFAYVTVLHQVEERRDNKLCYMCRCDCGTEFITTGKNLRSSITKSCGCYRAINAAKMFRTHGYTVNDSKSPEYTAWAHIKTRCDKPNTWNYERYGGRGIGYCVGVSDFMTFLAVVGERPGEAYSIDRIDNSKGYFCGSCCECTKNNHSCNLRWATLTQQARNTRRNVYVMFEGQTKTIAEWAELYNMKYETIYRRVVKYKWPIDEALNTPVRVGNYATKH